MDEPGQQGTGLEAYARRAREVQEVLLTEEREHLLRAARLLADSLVFEDERDRVIHVFGAGHSHLLAEEMFWRAGGLVPIHPILDPNLTPLGGPRSGPLERLEGYARILLSGEKLRLGEAMVVFSNSGINAAPVEMALSAQELGLRVVAVTSRAHADQMPSRHSSGRKLHELADVAIDTHVPPGDASVDLQDLAGEPAAGYRAGPLSTVAGALVANALVAEIAYLRMAAGADPVVLRSQNLPGSEETNEELIARYRKRIRFY